MSMCRAPSPSDLATVCCWSSRDVLVRSKCIWFGCGSPEGMSGGSWDGVVGVAGSVDALLFFGEVVVPVAVEVAVAVERAEFEDRFGAGQSPAGAGEVHPVFDEVPAGAFDDAGGDRPALGQGGRVVQVGTLVGQVGGAGVGVGPSGGVQAGDGGCSSEGTGDAGGAAGQDGLGVAADPGFGGGVAFGVEGPGCFPQVLQDVDEVALSRHRDSATYPNPGTMPTVGVRLCRKALRRWASRAGRRSRGRHSYRLSRKARSESGGL